MINPFFHYIRIQRARREQKIGCGIFGVINYENQTVFPYVYWGLRAQNHRGHQSHGFLTYGTKQFHTYKSLDLVPRLKNEAIHEWFSRLPGSVGIGNVRYTTSGKCDDASIIEGTQPVYRNRGRNKTCPLIQRQHRQHSASQKRDDQNFEDFHFNCDSDVVCHKLLLGLKQGKDLASAVRQVMESLDGASQ